MVKITEENSKYQHLEKMSTQELLENINAEDQTVAFAVKKTISQIETLVNIIVQNMKNGGRLFYLGAGTSGRLGILDASECPPTFGISADWVVGLIAGGDTAIRNAVENAEDDKEMAWKDLAKYQINEKDIIIGIAASGTTPYVIHGLRDAQKNGIVTGCITCNLESPLAGAADFPIEVIVGPEFITGSSRMKAGTAQKMVLNMISTSVMIQLGRVEGNKMVDMRLSNDKLWERGNNIIQNEIGVSRIDAKALLEKYGSVRKAIEYFDK
ncbi:MAG: N-acetylmuramic acid 6-phosphate etherase [Saprospiraceae bacterium]|nr:N-acetylmuramic acid 6-phosphate etherase [Saprospiraceae bacterium]